MRFAPLEWVIVAFIVTLGRGVLGQNNAAVCGGSTIEMNADTQPLTIPASGTFTEATTCEYTVTSSPGTAIRFTINEMNIGNVGHCDQDYIKVANTKEQLTNTSYKYCGSKLPTNSFSSASNSLFIEFKITTGLDTSKVVSVLTKFTPPETACGERQLTLKTESATIQFPAQGQQFISEVLCIYQITGNDERPLSFKITQINFETSADCGENFILVGESMDTIGQSKYKYCGTTIPQDPFNSTKNTLVIAVSSTKASDTVQGVYSKQTGQSGSNPNPAVCGSSTIELNTETKSITIPASGTFTTPTTCTYAVSSLAGSKIIFAITNMEIGTGGTCDSEYIKVANSQQEIASTAYKFCGTTLPQQNFTSDSNALFVELKVATNLEKSKVAVILTKINFGTRLAANKIGGMIMIVITLLSTYFNFI